MAKTLIAALIAGVLLSAPAQAAQCYPYPALEATLQEQYGEHLKAAYTVPLGALLFFSSNRGTWTAAAVDTESWVSCVISVGKGVAPFRRKRMGVNL
jgi:hypothetical protein